jgi:hypothetical protein
MPQFKLEVVRRVREHPTGETRPRGAWPSAKSPGAAIMTVSFVAYWINGGFGLIVNALLAKEVARLVHVDYRC